MARVDAVLATLSRNYPGTGPEGTPSSPVPFQHSSIMASASSQSGINPSVSSVDATPPTDGLRQDAVAPPSMAAAPLSLPSPPLSPSASNGLSSSIMARVDAVLTTLSRNYPDSGPEGTPPLSVLQDTVAPPSMAAAPLQDEVAPPSMAADPAPGSSLPGTDAAVAQPEGTSQENRADDLRKLREDKLSSFRQDASHLLLRRLTEPEWNQFEARVDAVAVLHTPLHTGGGDSRLRHSLRETTGQPRPCNHTQDVPPPIGLESDLPLSRIL